MMDLQQEQQTPSHHCDVTKKMIRIKIVVTEYSSAVLYIKKQIKSMLFSTLRRQIQNVISYLRLELSIRTMDHSKIEFLESYLSKKGGSI